MKEIIFISINLEHLSFGCNISFLNENFNTTISDLCSKHNTNLKSLHISSIKNNCNFNSRKNSYSHNFYYNYQTNLMNSNANYDLVTDELLKFTNLEYLSIDYEHLTNELLKNVCSKNLKRYISDHCVYN